MEIWTDLGAWHWLALGLTLLIAEALGAAGFLIGAAVAAFAMAIVMWMVPDAGVSFGYTPNYMHDGLELGPRGTALVTAVFDCL